MCPHFFTLYVIIDIDKRRERWKMIKLELTIKGKKKTYVADKVTVRTMREILGFYERQEKGEITSELEIMDEMIRLLLVIFKNTKLTYDDIVDNVGMDELVPLIENVMKQVQGGDVDQK